jgi:hypothetical protein
VSLLFVSVGVGYSPRLWAQTNDLQSSSFGLATASQAEEAYGQFLQSHSSLAGADLLGALQNFVSRWPTHAGAKLDLALLHCELGDWSAMDAQFRQMETLIHLPPVIRQFVSLQRQKSCNKDESHARQASGQWFWQASVGYSSNANLATNKAQVVFSPDAPLPSLDLAQTSRRQPDGFGSFSLGGQGLVYGSLRWQAVFSSKTHFRNAWLDQSGMQLELLQPLHLLLNDKEPLHLQNGRLRLGLSQWWVNDRLQESSVRVGLEQWFEPQGGAYGSLGFLMALHRQRFNQDPLFNAKRLEAGLRWAKSQPAEGQLQVGFDVFSDIPDAARPGGQSRGWLAHAGLNMPNRAGEASALVSVQESKDSEPYSNLFFGGTKRRQVRSQVLLRQTFRQESALTRFFEGSKVNFFCEIHFDRSQDTLPLFPYEAVGARFGLQGRW